MFAAVVLGIASSLSLSASSLSASSLPASSLPLSSWGLPLESSSSSSSSSSSLAVADGAIAAAAAAARARYLEGEFSLAVAAAEEADALFIEGPAFSTDAAVWNAWADAQATRAVALARMGDTNGADTAWRSIAVARPTWTPDKDFIPPKHVARHKQLRDAVLAGATFAVTLEAGGKTEYVFDGRTVVPGSTLDVIPGRHFLGRAGTGKVVVVDAPTTLRIGAAVVEAPTPAEPTITEDDGPPWALIGIGAGVVVVTGAVVATVLIVQTTATPAPTNPGGTSVFVDASILNRAVSP